MHLFLFSDGNFPVASTILTASCEVSGKHTAIVSNHLAMALWQAISEVADETASIFIRFDTRSMLEPILKQALIQITDVTLQDAVAPWFVVRPHARVMELRASFCPGSIPVTHALIPFTRVRLLSCPLE